MRKASLFSGIGGIDLAAHWAGMETEVFCEKEPYCQKVLRKHWPEVPIMYAIKAIDESTAYGNDCPGGRCEF